jgi:hypothetical protein
VSQAQHVRGVVDGLQVHAQQGRSRQVKLVQEIQYTAWWELKMMGLERLYVRLSTCVVWSMACRHRNEEAGRRGQCRRNMNNLRPVTPHGKCSGRWRVLRRYMHISTVHVHAKNALRR